MDLRVNFKTGIPPGLARAARLQSAVDRVHDSGGGVVTVGAGCWEMTTLFLRSGVELKLERGARLQAFSDLSRYPRPDSVSDDRSKPDTHLLAAIDCEDVAITGDGIIDGRDELFWEPARTVDEHLYGIFRYTVREGLRNRPFPLVQIVRCRNVKLRDFTITGAPGWALHLYDCDVASVTGLTVLGNPFGPHTDGIGINGSRDVRISDCHVDTGDDAIIIKSTEADMHCRNVTVTNCVVASNCAGLGLGADVFGTISDIVFSNCVVKKALRMIQVEMWYPGRVERAVFSGITGKTFPDPGVENERPIYVDIQENRRPGGDLGEIREMVFRDVICESRGRIMMTAQDGARIDGLKLDNIAVTVPDIEDPELVVPRAKSMQLSNHNPITRAVRAAVVADNVDRLILRDVEYRWPPSPRVPMHALCTRNVTGFVDDSPRLQPTHNTLDRIITF